MVQQVISEGAKYASARKALHKEMYELNDNRYMMFFLINLPISWTTYGGAWE